MKKAIKKYFLIYKYEWLLILCIITTVESVISTLLLIKYDPAIYGEQASFVFKLSAVIITLSSIITCIVIWIFREKIRKLLETIKAISEGNLVIAVNMDSDNKYDETYKILSNVVEEINNSKQEIDTFNNEILHEFKTPIAAIHGFAEHLIKTGDDIESPERIKYLQIIADESARLSELSQKKLLLAKMNACRIVTNKVKFDLSEQIKNCAILFLPEIEKKNIDLSLEVEDLSYLGNEEFMEHVWMNLLSNAVKFTPENGEISIKGFRDKSGITLMFCDSGIGICKESQKHIFDKYYQCPPNVQKDGSGIGLTVVKRIIELCAGSINVESAENEGTIFTIFLPE